MILVGLGSSITDENDPAANNQTVRQDLDFYRLDFAKDQAMLRVTIVSPWTHGGVIALFRELKPLLALQRKRFGRCRILVDRRGVPEPSADIATMVKAANRDFYQKTDRVALVVSSSLLKAEVRHSFPDQGTKAFLSLDAAELWLSNS